MVSVSVQTIETSPGAIEEWRPVVGYEGWYDVSNLGRVRRVMPSPWAKVGRILTAGLDGPGYLHVMLTRNGKTTTSSLHRLVARAFHGAPLPGQEVNHLNGVKTDDRAENLEWVTRSENHKHAFRIGLKSHANRFVGIKNGRAVITDLDAARIRSLKGVARQVDLAREYGITQGHVSRIQRGVAWHHPFSDSIL